MSRLLASALNKLADILFEAGDICVRAAFRLDPDNELVRQLEAEAAEWDQGHNGGTL
jgi:hypothetical protein